MTRTSPTPHSPRRISGLQQPSQLLALEPRYLFDAAALVTAVTTIDAVDESCTTPLYSAALKTAEDTTLNIPAFVLTFNDSSQSPYTITSVASDSATHGQVSLIGQTIQFIPDPDYNGNAQFSYTITNTLGDTDTATVTLGVTPEADAPAASADSNWAVEDTIPTATGNVLQTLAHSDAPSGTFGDAADTDVDGDTLTTTLVSSATGSYGSLVLNGDGSYTYTLDNANAVVNALDTGESLTDTFTYAASDGTASTNASLTITIFGSNDAPVANPDTATVAEGGTVTMLTGSVTSVRANDTDPDTAPGDLAVSLVGGPAHGSLMLNPDGTFSYTHDGSETTSDSFTYRLNDGSANSNTTTVSITVTPVNDAPTSAGLSNLSVQMGVSSSNVNLQAAFSDIEDGADGLAYTIASISNPELVSGEMGGDGNLILHYAPNTAGDATITIRATDTAGAFVESTFTATVIPAPANVNDTTVINAGPGPSTPQGASTTPADNSTTETDETTSILSDAIEEISPQEEPSYEAVDDTGEAPGQDLPAGTQQLIDVAAVQKTISEGGDPTATAPATAAGAEPSAGGENGASLSQQIKSEGGQFNAERAAVLSVLRQAAQFLNCAVRK